MHSSDKVMAAFIHYNLYETFSLSILIMCLSRTGHLQCIAEGPSRGLLKTLCVQQKAVLLYTSVYAWSNVSEVLNI